MKTFIIYCILLFCFAGCDPMVRLEYYAKNTTNSPIKLAYTEVNLNKIDTNEKKKGHNLYVIDTIVVIIKSGDSVKIDDWVGSGYARGYFNYYDSVIVRNLKIMQDTISYKKNYRDKKQWDYFVQRENRGIFVLHIDDSDF